MSGWSAATFMPRVLHRVGGHDARAAGVGDDGHAVALGQGLHGEGGGVVEQGLEGLGADDAGALEGGAVGDVGAGQGARVRRGGLGRRPRWCRP